MNQLRSNSEQVIEQRGISLTDLVAAGTMFLIADIVPAFPSNAYTTLHEHVGLTSCLPFCDYGVELAVVVVSGVYLLGRDALRRNS